MESKIELQKARDFGEVINDTFLFIRQNIKPLLKNYFTFCGIFLVFGMVAQGLQELRRLRNLNSLSTSLAQGRTLYGPSGVFANFGLEFLAVIFFNMLTGVAISVLITSYMALYKEKGNITPTTEEVWGYFKFFFLRALGSYFVLALLLVIALLFCVVPGVYLYPIFALFLPVMIIENASFSYAFNRSFSLIKENWWATFGALVIIVIIFYFAAILVTLPTSIITGISLVMHSQHGTQLTPLIFLTIFLHQIGQIFAIMPVVTACLCYFNLTEVKEGTGLLGRINQLGNTGKDHNLPTEEY